VIGVRGALAAFAVLTGVMAVLIASGADNAPGTVTNWGLLVSVPMLALALAVGALAVSPRPARR
jgi:hypothetical protein